MDSYQGLIDKAKQTEPDRIELAALAAMLYSFYNGIENIFKRIGRASEGAAAIGPPWHNELLESMARPNPDRPVVISAALRDRLRAYLAFRHMFRSVYSFLLRWERMATLVLDCRPTLRTLEGELESFLTAVGD